MSPFAKLNKKITSRVIPYQIPRLDVDLHKIESETQKIELSTQGLLSQIDELVGKLRNFRKDSQVLSGIFALLNDAIIRVDSSGNIQSINNSAEKMFGFPPHRVQGRSLYCLIGLSLDKILIRMPPSGILQTALEMPDGKVIDTSISMTKINHGANEEACEYIFIIRDISEVIRIKSLLRESDVRIEALQKALDGASDVIIITDKENKIIFVNKSFTEHTGYTFEEVKGKDPGFYKAGIVDSNVYDNLWETLRRREVWQGVLINKSKSGELLYDKTIITPVMNGDPKKPSYYIALKQIKLDENQMQLL